MTLTAFRQLWSVCTLLFCEQLVDKPVKNVKTHKRLTYSNLCLPANFHSAVYNVHRLATPRV